MSRFTENLWSDLAREHGPTLTAADRPAAGRARLRRPRVLAGGTLGLAGVGTVLVLTLGGTAATAPAFAVTKKPDGSVLVTLDYVKNKNLPALEASLAAKGINETVAIQMARGPASTDGPVTCAQGPGVSGPTVRVIVGTNGTETIAAGQSGGNTAEGSFHLAGCSTSNTGSGNTGTGG